MQREKWEALSVAHVPQMFAFGVLAQSVFAVEFLSAQRLMYVPSCVVNGDRMF